MCAIVGVYRRPSGDPSDARAAQLAASMLVELQHRGTHGAGLIAAGKEQSFARVRAMGPVVQVLTPNVCLGLPGHMAIAQTRYPTAGQKKDPDPERNLGPLYANTKYGGWVAVAHNGNFLGGNALRDELMRRGSILQTGTDTEVLLHLIAFSKQPTLREAIIEAVRALPLAYSLLILTQDHMYAVRDPLGVRPLLSGWWKNTARVFASESCAFDAVEAVVDGEVAPGEMIIVGERGEERLRVTPGALVPRPCIFERVYFMRSNSDGGRVMTARIAAGKRLAAYDPVPGSLIVGVPDSGLPAAYGYADQVGVGLTPGLVRVNTAFRAFMQDTPAERAATVRLKHAAVRTLIEGKKVTLVDDSLVRGDSSAGIVSKLMTAGAQEVHLRIASPRVIDACHYGIDTPTREELIAHKIPDDQDLAQKLGAASVRFLLHSDLVEATREATGESTYCTTCFDGIPLPVVTAQPPLAA